MTHHFSHFFAIDRVLNMHKFGQNQKNCEIGPRHQMPEFEIFEMLNF